MYIGALKGVLYGTAQVEADHKASPLRQELRQGLSNGLMIQALARAWLVRSVPLFLSPAGILSQRQSIANGVKLLILNYLLA
jgi:hypothetical protein